MARTISSSSVVATKPATFMLVSFRAGGRRRNIPGFNRGNVDWFPGLRAQEKNPLWRRELWRYFKEDWVA
jgi:hypothetical protein